MSPRRSRFVAVAVLAGQLLLLAAQSPDPSGSASNLLAAGALRFVSPLVWLVSTAGHGLSAIGGGLRLRATLEEENRALRAEVVASRRELLRHAALEREAGELARALGFAREGAFNLRAAAVVYLDDESSLRTLVLRVGARGAQRDQVVISEQGLVGRVIEAAGGWARVQLLTDRAAAVSVLLDRARRQGIARGAGANELEIEYLPRQVRVEVGERVISAGIDGVFPRGLEIGTVTSVEPGEERFSRVRVRTAVDFADLANVFLIERQKAPGATLGEPSP